MIDFTFEQLPKAVGQLYEKLENIERLLSQQVSPVEGDSDHLLTIEEAASFAHLSKLTIYGLVSKSEIPCMKKGKRLYFSRKELIEWIRSGRKKTLAETEITAHQFVHAKGK